MDGNCPFFSQAAGQNEEGWTIELVAKNLVDGSGRGSLGWWKPGRRYERRSCHYCHSADTVQDGASVATVDLFVFVCFLIVNMIR